MSLLSNATGQVQADFDAVTPGVISEIQALTILPGVTGGRRIKGQLFVTVPGSSGANAYSQGTHLGWFSDGGAAIAFTDGTTPIAAYTQGSLIGTVADPAPAPVRLDMTVTIKDIAFEQLDLFGGTMTQRERSAARF